MSIMEFEGSLFDDCHSVSNVKLVCKNGVISSYKILIASNSEYLKSLLAEVPVGDKVTIYLTFQTRPSIRVIQPTLCDVKISNNDKTNFDPIVTYSKSQYSIHILNIPDKIDNGVKR